MKLAGCFNGTKTSNMPKDQGKLDFLCHDPFKVAFMCNQLVSIFQGLFSAVSVPVTLGVGI